MIVRKSRADLQAMARAGAVVARAHEALAEALRPGMSTLDLDRLAERVITREGAVPSFKGYRGFPATLCTSPNEQVVHGIPSADAVLAEGDLVSIDCGAVVDGFHGDSAVTLVVGGEDAADPADLALVRTTREAMWAGVRACVVGNRIGDIGAAVQAHAETPGYGVVREYVGHGVGRALHEDPSVPNYGRRGRGLRLQAGWVLAVEPMFNRGTAATRQLPDGWTVVTGDGARSAHWEHTVAITEDGPRVLTARADDAPWLIDGLAAA